MKVVLAWAVALVATVVARADWKDLKPGMDRGAAWHCVGAPILQNHGHGVFEVWTYDAGGYVMFEAGSVTYWEPSKPAPAEGRPLVMHELAKPGQETVARRAAKPAPNIVAKS